MSGTMKIVICRATLGVRHTMCRMEVPINILVTATSLLDKADVLVIEAALLSLQTNIL